MVFLFYICTVIKNIKKMDISRYITIQAVQLKDNTLIPIWDERVSFEDDRDFGKTIHIKGDNTKHFQVVECMYDLKTRKIGSGIELDYFPNIDDMEFKKGQLVLVEKTNRKLIETTIADIIFEDYDLVVKRGKKFDTWDNKRFPNIVIEPNSLYSVKHWKPTYLLENGTKITYNHQLYHKF